MIMFVNGLMLAGLGGAAVPLALHLLSRARYRTVNWGAMMFLTGAGRNELRRGRIRQWMLLLIRMAVVAVLAVALARPVIGQATNAANEPKAIAAIVVDCSAS